MTATTLTTTSTHFEELMGRESNGISVSLLWNRDDDSLSVCVFDVSNDVSFELEVGAASPTDVFNHPFAYAAFRGLLAEPEQENDKDVGAPATVA